MVKRSREKGYLLANEVYKVWLLSEYAAMTFAMSAMSAMSAMFAIFAIFSRAFSKGFRRFARFAMMIG